MSQWKRIHEQATGALPVATLTKWGAALIALLLAAFLLTQSLFNSAPEEVEPLATGSQEPAGPGTQAQVAARIREEGLRQEAQRQAAERDLQRRRELGMTTPRATASLLPSGVIGGDPIMPSSEAEAELREVLRLEEIERRNRSLRSAPVAQSYRGISDNQPSQAAAESAAPEISSGTQTAQSFEPPPATGQSFQQSLEMFREAVTDLEASQADPALEATPPGHERELTLPPGLGAAAEVLAAPTKDYENPTTAVEPADPPGFERIYEGSFLEAVLVTQLSGDFPGPVLAAVSVPFYSADRQRILVPRGSRVIGTAAAVTSQDQSRLVVGFHRLLFPNGRWVALDFHGLNQVGEGALKDQVNRHYLSMFAAVGAVGIISGLTLQGSNPYAGGAQGFRAGSRARTGPGRHPNLAALSESFPHYHDSRRSPAAHLVHFRRTGSPSRRTVNHNPERRHTMRIRTWLTLFFLPLFAGGTAYAFFDISAPFQRALMIANQATLIANQVAQLATMNQQLGKLTEQFTHIKDSTLGQVGAITQPFTDLASVPGQLIGTGMSWKSDFTGAAGELATAVEQLSDGTSFTGAWRTKLQQADQTSEQDILTAYADLPVRLATQAAENYRNQRERGEKSTVLNYAVSDAASETRRRPSNRHWNPTTDFGPTPTNP